MQVFIDQDKHELRFLSAKPELEFNSNGVQKERDGVPVWLVKVLAAVGNDDDEVWKIKTAQRAAPEFDKLTRVTFGELLAREWETNGRHGIAFSSNGVAEGTEDLFE